MEDIVKGKELLLNDLKLKPDTLEKERLINQMGLNFAKFRH